MEHVHGEVLLRLTLIAQRLVRCLASDANMTVGEFHCIMQLYLERPCCVRKLADTLGIGATSTSKILRSLDNNGWIVRRLDVTDRRMERVTLTAQGTDVAHRILLAADQAALSIVEKLPAERRGSFLDCARAITQHCSSLS